MNLVSFVCTTYRRFTCVERIVAQFHAQTYPNKQLIIFNTDTEHPYSLGFEDANIVVVNNSINYETGNPYQNRGEICRDAVTHANGDYFMLADDDDVYLPWHIQQAVEGIKSTGHHAWKPEKSLFAMPGKIEFCQNTLEASVIVQMNRIREIGFRMDITGYEGLSWYTQLRNEGQLDEHNKNYVPSYVFNWSDPHDIAGHKQSGAIGSPNNFEEHKIQSRDFAQRPLQKLNPDVIRAFYKPFIVFLNTNKNSLNYDYFMRYVSTYSEEF